MSMKQLIKEWKSFLKETVPVHHRVVLNEVVELTESELDKHVFPLSDEELEQIRAWGGLSGDRPRFLGSGTMGVAWQVGDKVLKLTSDNAEAEAAINVQGKSNPHVYEIYNVGKRNDRFREELNRKFVIICELVGDTNSKDRFLDPAMQDAVQFLHNTRNKAKYRWVDNFSELMERFREALPNLGEIFSLPNEGGSEEAKLQKIVKTLGFSYPEQEAFILAWIANNGIYGTCLTSEEKALSCSQKPKFEYVDQVCKGLTFLFENGVEFQDLKTTNVMNDNGRLVIIDIGKSFVRNKQMIPDIE
jgi:serine/threonine protein kinase